MTAPFDIPAESVVRAVLDNGLTVLVRRDASAPVVAIVTYVKAGYFDETDDIVGIAHVLEHMYFKGTPARAVGQIARETKASGGYLNAHTIYDHTSYYTVLPSSGFKAGLEVQADAYAHSLIDPEELRKELEVIIQEARRKLDNPGAVSSETLYELLHDRHRMRRWRIGREDGLRTLGRDHLLRFYRNFYRPSNTILTIVGDVDAEDALAEVERHYGALDTGAPERVYGPAETSAPGFRLREWEGDIARTQVLAGWRTPPTKHRDTPLLDLAATVLGTGRASRLYRAVREKQLASSVSAYNYTPTETGVFVVHAETRPERAGDALRVSWAEVMGLRENGVAEGEMARARRIFESRWLRRLESMEGQASYLAEWEAAGSWTLGSEYLERLRTATAKEVTDAARRWLDPSQASVVAYRPEGTAPLAVDAQELGRTLGAVPPACMPEAADVVGVARVIGSGSATLERTEAGVHVFRAASGIPILVRVKPGAPIVHFGVFSGGGAFEEREAEAGLTTLMTRTALKGTARRSAGQIAADAELLGGSISPGVASESFGWSFSVPAAYLDEAVELLADVVQNPVFPEEGLEAERQVALADVATLRDDMYRYPMRLAVEAAYGSHPYGVPVMGTEESLPAIGAGTVRRWHRERALAGATTLAIVGDVEPQAAASLLARHFHALVLRAAVPVAAPEWPGATAVNMTTREKNQTAIAIAFQGPRRRDNERFAAMLAAGVASGLGGRFFEELRDRQSLAYTVQAFPVERSAGGMFIAYIATSPEKEDVARRGLLEEFRKLRDAPVTDAELSLARRYALGTHAIRQQSGSAVLADMLDAWVHGEGLHELDDYERRVSAVTAAELRELAAHWWDESRRVEGVVRGRARTSDA